MNKTKRPLLNRLWLAILIVLISGLSFPLSHAEANAGTQNWTSRVDQVPILMYHYVDALPDNADAVRKDLTVTRTDFVEQVAWLKAQGYKSITPDQLINALWHGGKLPDKPIMFTFDDGYANAYYNATPILMQYGYTGTFFVITNFLDEAKPGYLTWPLAREMFHDGMSIQDHTASHEDMRNRTHEWYQAEVVASAADIQKEIGVKPLFFCFPFNGYDEVAVHELEAAGFEAAFTENDTHFEYAVNTMHLPRIRIRGSMTLDMFAESIKTDG